MAAACGGVITPLVLEPSVSRTIMRDWSAGPPRSNWVIARPKPSPIAVPSSISPISSLSICCRNQDRSADKGTEVYARPAKSTSPTRPMDSSLMNSNSAGFNTAKRSFGVDAAAISSANIEVDTSMAITTSAPRDRLTVDSATRTGSAAAKMSKINDRYHHATTRAVAHRSACERHAAA